MYTNFIATFNLSPPQRATLRICRAILGVTFFLYLVTRISVSKDIFTIITHNIHWVLLVFLVFLCIRVLITYRCKVILGPPFNFHELLFATTLQTVLQTYTVSGSGIVAYIGMVSKGKKDQLLRGAHSFVNMRLHDIFVFGIVGLLTLVLSSPILEPAHYTILMVVMLCAILCPFAAHFIPKTGMQDEPREKMILLVCISFLQFALFVVSFATLLFAFGTPVDISTAIMACIINRLISYIPIHAFGGLGTIDMSTLYLFQLMQFTPPGITESIIAMRLITYLFHLPLLLGLSVCKIHNASND